MKKFTIITLGVCAAAVAMTACQQEPGTPEFESLEKSETFRMGDGTFELDYRFEYLSRYSDDSVAVKIRNAMTADFFGEEYAGASPTESAAAFDRAMADMYTDSEPGDHVWSGFMKIRSHRDVLHDRIVAYTVEQQEYMGGAHGMETVKYYNYDLRTGGRLTLDDVFTPEGKAALADRIRGKILEDHMKDNWEELNEENCYFGMDSVQPTDDFLLSGDHITFMYNPYDIACYAQGSTKVTLPLNGLDGLCEGIFMK